MRYLFSILLALFLTWGAHPLYGMTPSIQMSVDRDTITENDTLELNILIKGGNALSQPDIPEWGNFDVVSRNIGSSIEILNGQMEVTKSFDYVLAPRKAGTFKIGPIKTHIDGKSYQAGPLTINVLKGEKKQTYQPPPAPQQPNIPPGFPQFPQFPRNPWATPQQPAPSPRGDTFLTAEINKKEAYVGEQVLFVLRFYSSVSVQNAQLSLPEFKDFITEEILKERKYQVDLDGRTYAVNEWRMALFPTKAGDLKTGKTTVKGRVPIPFKRNPFDDPFFQGFGTTLPLKPKTFSAPSLSIQVKELPPAPPGFTGLVGSFTLQSDISKDQLSLGESADLKVEITGKGNIAEANLPPLQDIPFFKIYPGKPELNLNNDMNGVQGSKVFTYALVAERPGKAQIPSLELSFFDPETESYRQLSTPSYDIAIRGTAQDERLVTAGLQDATQGKEGPSRPLDLQPIKPSGQLLTIQALRPWEGYFWGGALALGPLFYLIFIIYQRQKEWARRHEEDLKASKAFRNFKGSVHKLKTSFPECLPALSQLVKAYFKDRFQIKKGAMTPLEIEKFLSSKEISAETVRRMIYLLEEIDSWKYGGGETHLPNEKELKQELIHLIRQIEKEQ